MLGDRLLKYTNYKFCCFDDETDGLNGHFTVPWQIAWIIGDKHKNEGSFNRFLWYPDMYVSKGAAAITGFDQRWLDDNKGGHKYRVWGIERVAEDPKKVLKEFSEFFLDEDLFLVGTNILRFDNVITKRAFERVGLSVEWAEIMLRTIDTLALGRSYKYDQPPPRNMSDKERLCWQMKMVNERTKCSLSSLAKDLGIPYRGNAHDALVDIEVNADVFRELVKKVNI